MNPGELRAQIRMLWSLDYCNERCVEIADAAADAWEEREKDHAVLLAEVLVLRNSDRDIREQLKASEQARQRAETIAAAALEYVDARQRLESTPYTKGSVGHTFIANQAIDAWLRLAALAPDETNGADMDDLLGPVDELAETLVAERDAAEQRLREAWQLADDLCDAAIAKCIDPETPRDGFFGLTYWQGQKDTARKLLAALAPAAPKESTP